MSQARIERDCAALRKARQHDPTRRDTTRLFAADQRLDLRLRLLHAADVRAFVEVVLANVVPGAHRVAAIDGHWHHRRMRKEKPYAWRARQLQRRNDLRPAASVIAQSMEPDCRGVRIRRGLDLDRRQKVRAHGIVRICGAAFYRRPRSRSSYGASETSTLERLPASAVAVKTA